MKPIDIKIFYLSYHNLLKNKFGINTLIPRKEAFSEMGRHFLIPKNLRIIALKELEEMGLVELVDRDNFILLDCKLNLKEDTNSFFKNVGLF